MVQGNPFYQNFNSENFMLLLLHFPVYNSCMVNATHTEGLEVSVQFQLTSEQNATIPTFTLTCISTGSPATTVSWRREDGTVNNRTVTEDENHHITSQILIYPEKATYNHKLAVTGRLLGEYECRVSNKIFSATGKLEVVGK